MSLDQEMRAALSREAETRAVPLPDVAQLIRGGRVRRRRRNVARAGVAVAAVVAVCAAALGVATLDPRAEGGQVVSPPTTTVAPPTLSRDGREVLEPGTYRMFVGRSAAGEVVSADVTVEGPHWKRGDFAVVSDQYDRTYAGFGVYQPWTLAAGTGCGSDPARTPVAGTPRGLAAQLAELPRSTVLQGPARTDALGVPSIHLRMRVDVECRGFYRVAQTSAGERGITYWGYPGAAPNVVIDFWVLDVAGMAVVVDEWHNLGAPAEVVAQAHAARTSITFVQGG